MIMVQKGFTLIEIMIVVAIISILSAIALPAYQSYIKKATYAEVIVGMAGAKVAIDNCYAVKKELSRCDTGAEIGEVLPTGAINKVLNTVSIAIDTAVITATPNTFKGIKGVGEVTPETCVLSPTVEVIGRLTWDYSGVCVDKGYIRP